MNPELLINGIYLMWLGIVLIYINKIRDWIDQEGLWDLAVIAGYFVAFVGFWIAFSGIVAVS